MWPIEEGTNLTKDEIESLENAGFKLERSEALKKGRESRFRTRVSKVAYCRINSAVTMEAKAIRHNVSKANQHEHFQLQSATS